MRKSIYVDLFFVRQMRTTSQILMSSAKNSITVDVSKMAQAENDFQLRCQIIEEVKERPLLYNKGHPKYQINSVHTEEFAHIRVAVGKTGEYNVIL